MPFIADALRLRGCEALTAVEAGGRTTDDRVQLTFAMENGHVVRGLLMRAFDKAVVSGDVVLRELMQRECTLPGEWEYLAGFRTRDCQPPPRDETVYRSLHRRLPVTEKNGEWRLRVPLMQRWLRQRG